MLKYRGIEITRRAYAVGHRRDNPPPRPLARGRGLVGKRQSVAAAGRPGGRSGRRRADQQRGGLAAQPDRVHQGGAGGRGQGRGRGPDVAQARAGGVGRV